MEEKNKRLPISVLMSTYIGDSIEYLKDSVSSILNQKQLPVEFIIVIDGDIKEDTRGYLEEIKFSGQVNIKLKQIKNCGLAGALNEGLKLVTQPYVARMDADDISLNSRLSIQFDYLMKNNLDVVAAWHEEFDLERPDFRQFKRAPKNHNEIEKSLTWRTILSHPTILVKTDYLKVIDGYRIDTVPHEDLDLYYRLMYSGAKFGCVQEALVKVRVTGQVERRSGWKIVISDIKVKKDAYLRGNYGLFKLVISTIPLVIFRLIPVRLKKVVYFFLRTK